MRKAMHTPGRWSVTTRIAPRAGFWIKAPVVNGRSAAICSVDNEADAYLIAASPDMLTALIAAEKRLVFADKHIDCSDELAIMRSAIAKATPPSTNTASSEQP